MQLVQLNSFGQLLLVFFLTLLTEVAWARYSMAASKKRAAVAAVWSMLIVIFGTLGTQIWLDNHWTVCASALASLIGTYYGVKWGKDE